MFDRIKRRLAGNSQPYWDRLYKEELLGGKIRQDTTLPKVLPLLQEHENILDFGSGPGGNIKLLASLLEGKTFHLVDHSEVALDFARDCYIGEKDERGNFFRYHLSLDNLQKDFFDAIISIQVLEHLKGFETIIAKLWNLIKPGGILIISVPVKGWRDRNPEHINKFTVGSMFNTLSAYTEWVTISPRTYSSRRGTLNTAFFVASKPL